MAGGSLGTVFVELDLDSSRYTRGQQALLKSATSVSLNIEQNFKNLGIKSSAEMDLMRQKIINSFEMIKNSSKATANDIVRAETAKTAQLKALNDQQFGHQTSMLAKLKTHWLGYAATVTAAIMVARQGWSMLEAGASYNEQKGVLDNLAKKYEMTADTIVREMARASAGMISNAKLMEIALGGIAKGLNPDQLVKLADAAKLLSDTVGQDATTALDNLTQALETGRVRGLKMYAGTTIDLRDAFGELETKLTEAERAQAMYALIMIHATKLQKEQTGAVDGTADALEKAAANVANFKTDVQRAFTMIVGTIIGAIKKIEDFRDAVRRAGGHNEHGEQNPAAAIPVKQDPLAEYKAQIKALQDLLKNRKENQDAVTKTRKEVYSLTEAWEQMSLVLKGEIAKADALDGYERRLIDINTYADKLIEKFQKLPESTRAAAMAMIEAYRTAKIDEVMIKDAQERLDNEIKFYSEIEANGQRVHDLKMRWIDEEQERLKRYYKDEAGAAKWARNEKIKLDADVKIENLQNIQAGMSASADAFETLSQLYAEDSSERKRLHEIAMAFNVAEKAALTAQAIVSAVAAIATQGSGDPYTAFVRVAAMAAAMVSLLASAGIAFSGSPSSAAPVAKAKSTLLGAEPGTESDSLAKSLQILEDIYSIEYTQLTRIYNEVKALNSNITGLVRSIAMTGGTDFSGLKWTTSQNIGESSWAKGISGMWGENLFKYIFPKDSFDGKIASAFKYFDPLAGSISLFGKLMSSMFGGKTTIKRYAAGIDINEKTLEDILEGGVDARQYAKYVKKKEGGWFGKDKKSYFTEYEALNRNVADMLDLVFQNMSYTFLEIAKGLGTDINKVMNYTFEHLEIELLGKTTEEITKILSAKFSQISDIAVDELFGDMLRGYQQLNEGLMETAVRLITDKAVILENLRMTNQAFHGTIPEAIKFSETLIKIAGSLEKLTDAMQVYYEAFFNDAEKQSKLKTQLTEIMAMYGMGLPGTRAGYRSLVESLNLTTEAGQAAYVALMQMAKGADEYYSYLERAAESGRANIRPENYATYYEYQKALAGIPKFADGGWFGGGYRIVGEQGPELEFTGASRIYNSDQTKSLLSTDELISEIRRLRNETGEANFAIAANTAKFTKLLARWDADGLPEERVLT